MTCSSLCEAVDVARPMVKIPVFKINEPMAEESVNRGNKIVVMGTLQSVLTPTVHLIKLKAKENRKKIDVKEVSCTSAFDALISDNPQRHDELLLTELEKVAKEADTIVFAQGSMSRLIPEARKRVNIPVLECLQSGDRC